MNWINNLSLKWKLWIPLSIISSALVALTIVAISTTESIGGKTHTLGNQYLPSVDFLLQADRDLYQSLVAEHSLPLVERGTDAFKALLKQHSENMEQASTRVGKFAALHDDPEFKARYADYNKLREQWEKLSNEVVSLYSQGTDESRAKALALSLGEAETVFEEMRSVIDNLTEMTLGKITELRESASDTIDAGISMT